MIYPRLGDVDPDTASGISRYLYCFYDQRGFSYQRYCVYRQFL